MINSAIDEAGEAADDGKDGQGPSSFSDNVLVFETWVTDMAAALTDDSADEQRLTTIFDGVAELYRELIAQQLIELNEGRSDSDAYRKFEALKPTLRAILDDVRPRFMTSHDVGRRAAAPRRASGMRPVAAIDKGIGSIDDVAMEARLTRLEVTAEHTAKTIDTMQKRMDDGFRVVRSSIEALRKRMDEGFYAANRRMDDGFNAAYKRMDDGFKEARATSDSLQKRMDDGFNAAHKRMDDGFRESRSEVAAALKEVRSEASANFRVLVGIQVTTLLAVITLSAKMANMF